MGNPAGFCPENGPILVQKNVWAFGHFCVNIPLKMCKISTSAIRFFKLCMIHTQCHNIYENIFFVVCMTNIISEVHCFLRTLYQTLCENLIYSPTSIKTFPWTKNIHTAQLATWNNVLKQMLVLYIYIYIWQYIFYLFWVIYVSSSIK